MADALRLAEFTATPSGEDVYLHGFAAGFTARLTRRPPTRLTVWELRGLTPPARQVRSPPMLDRRLLACCSPSSRRRRRRPPRPAANSPPSPRRCRSSSTTGDLAGAVTVVGRKDGILTTRPSACATSPRSPDDEGHPLPHRVDDQADHGDRHHDPGRRGEAEPGRRRGEAPARVHRARCSSPNAARTRSPSKKPRRADHAPRPAHAHLRASPTTRRASTTCTRSATARSPRPRSPTALQPLQFEPGSKWAYCNPGIDTLGRVIEVVSGETLRGLPAEAASSTRSA